MKNLLLLLTVILMIACKGKLEVVENKDENGNLIELYNRSTEDFSKQGAYIKYAPAGNAIEEAHYINDTLHGKRVLYFDNGKPQIVENYVMGEFVGLYQAYYSNGQLELSGKYANGAMEGIWERYYESGEIMERVPFKKNQENGPFKEYYRNGKLKAEGAYLEGDKEHGELKLYSKDGRLEREMMCDRGVCKTTWKRDDIVDEEF